MNQQAGELDLDGLGLEVGAMPWMPFTQPRPDDL
jgi:hypothetical protein